MASYSGFIRKAPADRLRRFSEARGVVAPDELDWSGEGRGTAFVRSIDELLGGLPDLKQDALKADLDLFANLSDGNGLTAAERICAGEAIDLEGLQGVQDVLLMLAAYYPWIIDRIAAEASLMRRTGGRNWSALQFNEDGKPWSPDDWTARTAFLEEAIDILDLPEHRKREADWYKTIRVHPVTGEEPEIVQATIYVEERAESELAFGPSDTLERQIVQKVLEVGFACDAKERVVETPRQDVLLDTLHTNLEFQKEPADGIERAEVSSLDFFSTGGGFARMEKRGEDETIYEFLERRFGGYSPLITGDWQLIGSTVRIVLAA